MILDRSAEVILEHKDFLEGVFDIYFEGAIGNKLMREFSSDESEYYMGIRAGVYYSSFARLAVYLENKYSISNVKMIQTSHVHELLEYLRSKKGFKDSTLKGYISAIRHVYKEQQRLFSDEFVIPTNSAYEQYRQKNNAT